MRRLAHLTRPFTALFALWFAVVLGDPGMLHACPMHGGGSHGTEHGAALSTAGHDVGVMHGAHAGEDAPPDGTQHHGAPDYCTCVGHCCAASLVPPLAAVAEVHVPAAEAMSRRPLAAHASDAPSSPDLRLPFANGPPIA
jgi:hypothetical protein